MKSPWFKDAFGAHYTAVYAHRDDREAEEHLPQIQELAGLDSCSGRILDLGCGTGRYTRLLEAAGHQLIGLDFSMDLLSKAKTQNHQTPLLRGNMLSLPFGPNFERVISLFTSFGYFDEDDLNAKVLAEMARVLQRGGRLYLDYLNPATVRASSSTKQKLEGGAMISEKRISEEHNMVIKDVTWIPDRGEPISYNERVKLYDLDWFSRTGASCGLDLEQVHGDYSGGTLEQSSPRQIMIFSRP